MRKLVSMFAVFGLAALIAAYVALAPLATSGPGTLQDPLALFDQGAARISGIGGRSMAVLVLLGGGMVLGMIAGVLVGGRAAKADPDEAMPAPGPVWRPEPLASDDRIANLRRRAGVEVVEEPAEEQVAETAFTDSSNDEVQAPQIEAASLPPHPVMLVRKARERDRDWTQDRTWFGGQPRLGDIPWPRDEQGRPLPFAAQVDLAELAAACPESPLPKTGSLAFFLGSGAVLQVSEGQHPFTLAPEDLPPAFDEGGYPFPQRPNRLSRDTFRFWPAEAIAIDMPTDMRTFENEERHGEITDTMYDLLDAKVPERRSHFPDSEGPADGASDLWWFAVRHLSDALQIAQDRAAERLADAARAADAAAETLAMHEAEPDADPALVDSARAHLAQAETWLKKISGQCEALPEMVAAVGQFAADRAPWERLTLEECGVVADVIRESRNSYPDLVRYYLPHSAGELTDMCIREMMTGDAAALAALPQAMLDQRNRRRRLTHSMQHQMFGLGACPQNALYEHLDDLMLLQLAYDADMDWRFGDMGIFQFWISPEDAAAGRWEKAEMTFEMG